MGTTLHYVGNFSAEEGELTRIEDEVSAALTAMTTTLEGMPAYWKDEKSDAFIEASNQYISETKTKMAKAIAAGKQTLKDVEEALKIYQ